MPLVKRKIGELRVAELRAELERRNIDNKGLKGTLLQKLQKAILDEGGDLNDITINFIASPSGKKTPKKKADEPIKSEKAKKDDTAAPVSAKVEQPDVEQVDDDVMKVEPSLEDDVGMKEMPPIEDAIEVEGADQPSEDDLVVEEATSGMEEVDDGMEDRGDVVEVDERLEDTEVDGEPLDGMPLDGQPLDGEPLEEQDYDKSIEVESDNRDESQYEDAQEDLHQEEISQEDSQDDSLESSHRCDHHQEDVEDSHVEHEDSGQMEQEGQTEEEEERSTEDQGASGGEEQHPDASDNEQDRSDNLEQNVEGKDKHEDVGEQSEAGKEEVIVSIEEDVLDMLDYDLEEKVEVEEGKGREEAPVKSAARVGEDGGCKNLWVSGLSATTRASELKVAFSRYGKVVGAKVVTNAKSPGSKCFGFVAMASASAADKCILHLNKTEMHGRTILVERTMSDPSASRSDRKSTSDKSTNNKDQNKNDKSSKESSSLDKKNGDKKATNHNGGNKDVKPTPRRRSQTDESRMERQNSWRAGDKRHGGSKANFPRDEPHRKRIRHQDHAGRKVVIDNNKGEVSLRVNVSGNSSNDRKTKPRRSPVRGGNTLGENPRAGSERNAARGGSDKPVRRSADLDKPRYVGEKPRRDVLTLEQIRAQRREPPRRKDPKMEPDRMKDSRRTLAASASDLERERLLLRREREEREILRLEREKLERERRQLERDRMEREKLEQERLRLEMERKKELEKIEREKEEMRRLQEIDRYEHAQRQRAIKRSYDDAPSNGGYHGNKRSYDGAQHDGRRSDRDDRKYAEFDRTSQSYRGQPRGSSSVSGAGSNRISRVKTNDYHDVDRRGAPTNHRAVDVDRRGATVTHRGTEPHHDTDARYNSELRRVEKYGRGNPQKSGSYREFGSTGGTGGAERRVEDRSTTHRSGEDNRKVVARERTQNFRRSSETQRGDAASMGRDARGDRDGRGDWGKSRGRVSDRDLREEIRGRQGDFEEHKTLNHSERRSGSRSVVDRRDDNYSSRSTRPATESSGKPIPTQTTRGVTQQGTTWPSTWTDRNISTSIWPGGAVPAVSSGRTIASLPPPAFGTIAPTPTPLPISGGLMAMNPTYIASERTVESRFPSYKAVRRY